MLCCNGLLNEGWVCSHVEGLSMTMQVLLMVSLRVQSTDGTCRGIVGVRQSLQALASRQPRLLGSRLPEGSDHPWKGYRGNLKAVEVNPASWGFEGSA